ncbi:MAG: sensor histidine kinase [Imperialibacter sp.]|uniref:sensor histidine kinase n=1 Tax=Imperialibacter sp. TaxID=2038411 RepID=UPI003A88EC7B
MQYPLKEATTLEFYKDNSNFKWVVVLIAILISIGSIYYTNIVVESLKEREKRLIDLFANTLEYTANEDGEANLTFIFDEIIVANNSIPVIIADEFGIPSQSKNVKKADEAKTERERIRILAETLKDMEKDHEPIVVTLRNKNKNYEITGYNYIYYQNSDLLKQLTYYPYIQLSVIFLFGLIAYIAFNSSRSAEQNRVWVGLAKETAHQLGTPLSSLMAWVEYFKTDDRFKDSDIIPELNKDIERLEMITSRFSNIGSVPQLNEENLYDALEETISYLQKRVSTRVKFILSAFPNKDIKADINKPLFAWVVENLCKNAVDAMSGTGTIEIKILKANEGKVMVDISDTGKGIPKSKIGSVFQPGYTSKKRGWGLGLTLVKRIIENYHTGKIFVKSSELDKGTTFRIVLKV